MEPTISVDLSKALLRFSEAGIPMYVRNNLRNLIPPLAHRITASIEDKMNTQLKSRNTLTVSQKMRDNSSQITMEIQILSPSAGGLLPTYLELGTRPHDISPRGDSATFFFEKIGRWHTYTKLNPVHHPGTRAYMFLDQTVAEFMGDIHDTLNQAVQDLPE